MQTDDPQPAIKSQVASPAPRLGVRLDWRAYFAEFCELHGRVPIPWRGRLLFPDGWTYSSSDHSGPEWPPPQDPAELAQMRKVYWTKRLGMARRDRDDLKAKLQGLEAMQAGKSAPLQQMTQTFVEGVGQDGMPQVRGKVLRGALDLAALRGKLEWLQEDVSICEAELKQLQGVKA